MHTLNAARSRVARLALVGATVLLVLLGLAGTAEAHPFGTPPVAKIKAYGASVEVTWSAQKDDLAVLGEQSKGNEAAYLGSHVTVRQDGRTCRTAGVDTSQLSLRGALLRYTCPKPVDKVALTVTALTDVNKAYRTISVTEAGGGGLHTADDPTRTLVLGPDGSSTAGVAASPASMWTTDLAGLLQHRVVLPLALLVAAAVGAFHACAPGHGKSLAAGFLVGGQGRAWDAVRLGAVVAVMHTFSVAALAVGWWLAAESAPDVAALTSWLQLIAALVVLAVGVVLLRRHLHNRKHGHSPGHGHDHSHEHTHSGSHSHGPGHTHTHHIPAPRSLLTWRGILLLGTSGGLLPSPSAFLVLLSGLLTGRVGAAVAMVVAFGLGMAATLTAVGLVVLRGRDAFLARASTSRALRAWSRRVPLVAASAVVAGGTVASALAAGRVLAP
ncbi:hypothetical protein [Streptomyces sp. NPDC058545]|uniref:hypothetical protein n=1 Tax=Streptomyces sp. NPDC058545 TaxID=3346544 RepID=UPI0036558488